MLHRAEKSSGGDIATEMTNLLDWAEGKGIIKHDQHSALMREFSRRVEIKARENKRITSTDNLLSYGMNNINKTVKKGISMMDLGKTPSKAGGREVEGEQHFLNYELNTDAREENEEKFGSDCVIC